MVNRKMLILAAIMITIVIVLFGCQGRRESGGNQRGAIISVYDVPIAPDEIRNTLDGMDIILSNWWTNYDTDTFVPRNEIEEEQLEFRKKLQSEYNFRMRDMNIGGWGETQQLAATSIMAGRPAASVFRLQADWALALYRQNLLYPVSNSSAVDWNATTPVEWNRHVADAFTFNNRTYAFTAGYGRSESATVVFWNKRLFREAGLDPNLPYDLQKAGTWTWDKFLEISKQLTRDVDNDGIIDIYAMPSDFSIDILDALVSSNGAMFVGKDENGRLFNASGRPEFIEAVRFYMRLRDEGVMKPKPDGVHWNWFISEFLDGNVAMRIAPQHAAGDIRTMRDDWGMVLPPRGPRSENYVVFNSESVMVIPSRGFTDREVDAILWALQAWISPVIEDWRLIQYPYFRDRRAVDETLVLLRDKSLLKWRYHQHVPGFSTSGIAWELWHHDGEAAQLVESVSQNWNALINDANEL